MRMNREFLIKGLSPAFLSRLVGVVKTENGYELVARGRRLKVVKDEA